MCNSCLINIVSFQRISYVLVFSHGILKVFSTKQVDFVSATTQPLRFPKVRSILVKSAVSTSITVNLGSLTLAFATGSRKGPTLEHIITKCF